jgi:hypothetical protein
MLSLFEHKDQQEVALNYMAFKGTRILLLSILIIILCSCKRSNSVEPDSVLTSKLPDTGQTTSYTTTPGEDSDFTINTPSYTDNGNGTITDNITGLMWQKTDGGEMTFENASAYVTILSLGGYTDWRLPTGLELYSINNHDKVNPALNTTYFAKTAAEYWWTSETRADDISSVWVVNAGGGIGAHPITETISAGGAKHFHVRAVRNISSQYVINEHFKDNSDGTITDYNTGLIWQKMQPSSTMTWEEALNYASTLSLAGSSGWRLPNIKEIQSLNDPKLFKPSFNKAYFPNILSGNFWSSTSQVNAPAKAWDIDIDYGIVSYSDKTLKENVLCVRGGI